MINYKGTYKDSLGATEILITNNFTTLNLAIEGIQFSGLEFSDLSVTDKTQYAATQLQRFSFMQTPIYGTNKISETLCNCTFEISMPIVLIDKHKPQFPEFYTTLNIEYHLGNATNNGLEFERLKLSLFVGGEFYKGEGDFFETAFDQIQQQFAGKYQLKNCYGCMYADYSVYGQSSFGSMFCFVGEKEKYMKVSSKEDYMRLEPSKRVQEIYSCEYYEIRKQGVGYRG